MINHLSREDFIRWVFKNKNITVGYSCTLDDSPLSRWMAEQTGERVLIKGFGRIMIGGKIIPFEDIPDWIEGMLEITDSIVLPNGRIRGKMLLKRLVV